MTGVDDARPTGSTGAPAPLPAARGRSAVEASLEQRVIELAALNAVARAVNASLSVADTAHAALTGVLDAVQPDLAVLFLRQGDDLILQGMLPEGAGERIGELGSHRVGECICGLAAQTAQAVYSPNILTDSRCTWEQCKRAGIVSFAALPIKGTGGVFGVIGLGTYAERDFEEQMTFLETLADQVSAAFANARLYEEAQRELAERRRAEAELARSQAQLQSIVTSEPECVKVLDRAGRVIDMNPAGLAMIDADSIEEVRGRCMCPLVTEGPDRDAFDEMLAAVFRGERREFAFGITGLKGTVRRLETHAVPLWDARHESVEALLGVTHDITERDRAAAALAESEARYRLLFEANPHPMWVYDTESLAFMEVNDAAVSHYGYSREEFLAMTIADIRPEEDLPRLLESVARAGEHLVDEAGVWRHRRKDGSIVDVEITSHVLEFRGRRAELVLANDITERRRAEDSLRASESKFRSIAEQLSSLIFVTDGTGVIKYVSPAAVQVFGCRPADMVGRHFGEFLDAPDLPKATRAFRETLAMGHVTRGLELRMRRADGTVFSGELDAQRAHFGDLSGTLGLIHDITARKTAEADRERLQAQLTQSQKMESVGRLAGGVAHDFNNMLHVILGQAELALRELPADSPLHDSLVEIEQCARRSADLTHQLLAFARRQPISPRRLDLNDAIGRSLNMLRRLIGENVELLWHPGGGLWPVEADLGQVDQILANLVVNARDAIPDVGRITIETRNIAASEADCASRPGLQPGDYVQISVQDTGCGMEPDTLARLFEPFFTTKPVGQGTGLGLATVYGAVKQNHGFVYAVSALGLGSTFTILLPRTAGG